MVTVVKNRGIKTGFSDYADDVGPQQSGDMGGIRAIVKRDVVTPNS